MAASFWRTVIGAANPNEDFGGIEFWSNPERTGWLLKQGEHIKTWRRRWFVLKQGKLFWFKDSTITRGSTPRGVIPVATYLTVKGAEDILHKPGAFELSNRSETMYFIADSEKEKEDWINSIGRSIVQHSRIHLSSIVFKGMTCFVEASVVVSQVYKFLYVPLNEIHSNPLC